MFKSFALVFVVIMIVVFAYTAETQVVTDGLVSYWSFEGGDVTDQVGDNDGTIVGDPEVVAGQVGDALRLDGQGDAVTFPTNGFPTGNAAMTWSAWFQREVSDRGASQLIVTYGPWTGPGLCFGLGTRNNDKLFMAQYGPVFDTWGPVVSLGDWHYVAAVYNGNQNNTIYLDGEEAGNRDLAQAPQVAEGDGAIGGNMPSLNELWVGLVDEVGFYNRALSEADARQNWEAGLAGVEAAGKLTTTWAKIKASR